MAKLKNRHKHKGFRFSVLGCHTNILTILFMKRSLTIEFDNDECLIDKAVYHCKR